MTLNEVTNEIVKDAKHYASTEGKKAFMSWVVAKVLPAAKEMGYAYADAVKATAADEKGWCRFRDSLFIPGLISVALWGVEMAINKSMTE